MRNSPTKEIKIPPLLTLAYCSLLVTYCSLNLPIQVYMALRFYLLRTVATLKNTNCFEKPDTFCFRPCLTATCFLTKSYQSQILLACPIRIYNDNHHRNAYAYVHALSIVTPAINGC